MLFFAAALTFVGMLGLCTAMDRHQGQVLMAKLTASQARLLRITAILLLLGGFSMAIVARGGATGSVVWVVLCGAASVCIVLLLAFYPRLLPRLGLLALLAGGLAGVIELL